MSGYSLLRPSRAAGPLWKSTVGVLLLLGLSFGAVSCDFFVKIEVINESTTDVSVVVNDNNASAIVVRSGETRRLGTSVNESLERVTITSLSPSTESVVTTYDRDRGFNAYLVITGPPLAVSSREESY